MRHSRFPVRHFRVPLFPSLSLFSYECTRSRAHVARRRVTPSYALRSPRNPSGYTSEYTHDVYTRVQRARTRRYSCARARARAPTRPRQGRAMCIANRITCTHIARIAHRSSRTSARFLSLSLSLSLSLCLLLPFTLSSPSIFSFSFSPLRSLISLSAIFLASRDAFPVLLLLLLLLLLFLSEASCTISFHLFFSTRDIVTKCLHERKLLVRQLASTINIQR